MPQSKFVQPRAKAVKEIVKSILVVFVIFNIFV